MDEWVVWFYVEPFTLYMNRDSGRDLLYPIVLVPVPVPVPDTASVITVRMKSLFISREFNEPLCSIRLQVFSERKWKVATYITDFNAEIVLSAICN